MAELDLQGELHRLHESLTQIESLLAWEQLKRGEDQPGRIDIFPMHDPVDNDLKNEYTFLVAGMARVRSILNNHTIHISEAMREGVQRHLAWFEQKTHALDLHHQFGGAGG